MTRSILGHRVLHIHFCSKKKKTNIREKYDDTTAGLNRLDDPLRGHLEVELLSGRTL